MEAGGLICANEKELVAFYGGIKYSCVDYESHSIVQTVVGGRSKCGIVVLNITGRE